MSNLDVCGFIEPGSGWIKIFKAQINDFFNHHGIVPSLKQNLDIFNLVRVVIHFCFYQKKIISTLFVIQP
jgi:hypothetical protein